MKWGENTVSKWKQTKKKIAFSRNNVRIEKQNFVFCLCAMCTLGKLNKQKVLWMTDFVCGGVYIRLLS